MNIIKTGSAEENDVVSLASIEKENRWYKRMYKSFRETVRDELKEMWNK